MSLESILAKLNNEGNTSTDNDIENPYSKLAHQTLQLSKKNPKYLVRILPPVGDNEIFAEYRRWFTHYESRAGAKTTMMTLSATKDPEDPLEDYINKLYSAGKLVNQFGGDNWPSRRFLFNVVPCRINENHQVEMVLDEKGLPDVYVLELNKGQTTELINSLAEELNNPNLNPNVTAHFGVQPTKELSEYSFASSLLAYPVYLVRNPTKPVTFTQQILTQYPLPPLPQGWETKLEDLNALTLPTYKQSRSFVDYVVNQGSSLLASQPSEEPSVETPTGQVPWTVPSENQEYNPTANYAVPTPPVQQYQAPVAPTPSYSVPTPPVQPQYQAPVAPAQQYQAPVAPTQQQATTQASNTAPSPLANLGRTIASQEPKTQPQAPQTPAQPEQQAQAQAPVAPDNLNDSLNDIMKDAGLDSLDINL